MLEENYNEVDNSGTTYEYTPYISPTQQQELKQNKPQKKGFFKKGIKLVAGALVFGLVAGSAFYGVNYAGDKLLGTNTVTGNTNTSAITLNTVSGSTQNTNLAIMDMSVIAENATPSIVQINGTVTSTNYYSFFTGETYESPCSGSGIIIGQNDTELLIVTNAHVVEDVNSLTVTFNNDATAAAVVKGSKSSSDLAVIAVELASLDADTLNSIAIAEIGNSDELRVGEPVIAIGNALGEGISVTVGWVSALNRTITIDSTVYENLIMTDAAINPGNSGGALLNSQGQVIGINSAKYTDEKVEGMGYAIPISSVADIIEDLMNKETRTQVAEENASYLGITAMDITDSISKSYGWPVGVSVMQVAEGSPAAAAGLVKYDIIYSFDGEEVENFEELRKTMSYYRAGETVVIGYYHLNNGEYEERSVEVTLGSKSEMK